MLRSPAYSTSIATPETAEKHLCNHFLLLLNQTPGHSSLSHALLHLTFTAAGITTPAADAIRSITILIDSLTPAPPSIQLLPPSPTTATATPTPQWGAYTALLENQVTLLGTCIQELWEVVDKNNSSANIITHVIDEVKDDLHNMAQYMTDTAKELVTAAKTPTQSFHPPPQAFSYVDAAQQKLPLIAVARCLAQTKIIKITPPRGDPTASFKDLNEDVLIEKANIALWTYQKIQHLPPWWSGFHFGKENCSRAHSIWSWLSGNCRVVTIPRRCQNLHLQVWIEHLPGYQALLCSCRVCAYPLQPLQSTPIYDLLGLYISTDVSTYEVLTGWTTKHFTTLHYTTLHYTTHLW